MTAVPDNSNSTGLFPKGYEENRWIAPFAAYSKVMGRTIQPLSVGSDSKMAELAKRIASVLSTVIVAPITLSVAAGCHIHNCFQPDEKEITAFPPKPRSPAPVAPAVPTAPKTRAKKTPSSSNHVDTISLRINGTTYQLNLSKQTANLQDFIQDCSNKQQGPWKQFKLQVSCEEHAHLKNHEIADLLTTILREHPELESFEAYRIIPKPDTEVTLTENQFTSVCAAIKSHPNLSKVVLTGNHFRDGFALRHIADTIKNNPRIHTLDLSDNNIRKSDIEPLTQELRHNSSVKDLNLYWNELYADGAEEVANMLRSNRTLTSLNLGGNNISNKNFLQRDSKGVAELASSITNHPSLTALNLKRNYLESDVEIIADILRNGNNITILDLSYNRIDGTGAESLASAIRVNKGIKFLSLYWNRLGDENHRGTSLITSAMRANTSLKIVDLAGNSLFAKEDAHRALEDTVEQSKNLYRVRYSSSEKGLSAFLTFGLSLLIGKEEPGVIINQNNKLADGETLPSF